MAMCGCLLLVTTKLFGVAAGIVTAVVGAAPFAGLWFAVPLSRLRMLDGRQRDQSHQRSWRSALLSMRA